MNWLMYQKYAIEVRNLAKNYGKLVAVDGVSFDVKDGEIFGFIGPNGAGKTTTIRILTTLLPPSRGEVKVLGYNVRNYGDEIRCRIGYVQQQLSVEYFLTVRENLDTYGLLWGVEKQERRRRAEFLADKFGLRDVFNKKALELSMGQRKRLQVAREFMHDMELLFLDEPAVGLDPIVKRTLLDFVREKVKEEKVTVFFTTHIMSEAEYLCDRIAIIDKGKILACGTTKELKKKFNVETMLELVIQEKDANPIELVESVPGVKKATLSADSRSLRISVKDPYSQTPIILNTLLKEGYHVTELHVKEPDLEDVFIRAVKLGETKDE